MRLVAPLVLTLAACFADLPEEGPGTIACSGCSSAGPEGAFADAGSSSCPWLRCGETCCGPAEKACCEDTCCVDQGHCLGGQCCGNLMCGASCCGIGARECCPDGECPDDFDRCPARGCRAGTFNCGDNTCCPQGTRCCGSTTCCREGKSCLFGFCS